MTVAAAVAIAAAATVLFIRRVPTDVPPPPDYAADAAWLCRPGRADPCAVPTSATIFEPDGRTRAEIYRADLAAPVDCFYVYPTVSRVRAAYAPIASNAETAEIVRNQFARFASVCRPFAPLYRQVTLRGLRDLFVGRRGVTIDVPYADIVAAWRAYLAKDNGGRGVVLIGHSQGSRLLARLIAEEIDGKPAAAQLVTAMIPGTRVDVPEGKRVGGIYRMTPLCDSATETGCVIVYASYPADAKIPPNARYGVSPIPGMRFGCVDPAAIDGAKTLDAALPLPPALRDKYGTDFAAVPGLLSASCKDDGPFSVLAVAADPHDHAGDTAKAFLEHVARVNPSVGLHVLDINLALGTLVDLVRQKTAAYLRR